MNRFSLIVPTYGRDLEFKMFLESLLVQTYKEFEVIVVDQNKDDVIINIVNEYKDLLDIKYKKSDKLGLSYNRNIGVQMANGNLIAFPDDDCEYDKSTLEEVNNFFNNSDYEIYTSKVIDKNTRKSFGKSENFNGKLKFSKVMTNCVSISIFIKFRDVRDIQFDEELGVGAKFPSGEESDLVFSLLHKGYKGFYYADKYIYHPYKENDDSRVKGDSLGLGALMKKEIVYRKNYRMIGFYFSRLIRPIVGLVLVNKRRSYFISAIKYRLEGFKNYKRSN